jgi:hypothetical protein
MRLQRSVASCGHATKGVWLVMETLETIVSGSVHRLFVSFDFVEKWGQVDLKKHQKIALRLMSVDQR